MGIAARKSDSLAAPAIVDRATLTLFLSDIAESVGADCYMLLATASRERRIIGRVLASNWVFDAVELVGAEALGDLAQSNLATLPGARPQSILTTAGGASEAGISAQSASLLHHLGHVELFCLRLNVGHNHYTLALSSDRSDSICAEMLGETQMRCNYALSSMQDALRATILKDVLSPRERECLAWAAQGKTSEDIALILDIHANAANTAIASAIEKLHARNRVEAVATAIRTGVL